MQHPENYGSDEILNQGEQGPIFLVHGREDVYGVGVDWTLAIPDQLRNDTLNVIAPGFGGIKSSSRALRTACAENGDATLSFGPARHDKRALTKNILAPQGIHVATLDHIINSAGEVLRSQRGLPHRKEVSTEKTSIIAHSMGGLAATLYAKHNLGKVESVRYLASANFDGPTFKSLAETFPKNLGWSLRNEMAPQKTNRGDSPSEQKNRANFLKTYKAVLNLALYYASHPDRSIGEGGSCLLSDLSEDVAWITSEGVFTSYDYFDHDLLVPRMPHIAKYVSQYRERENLGHFAPQVHPRTVARQLREAIVSIKPSMSMAA